MQRDNMVLLGLGANLGRPLEQIADALRELRRDVALERISSVYRTEPVGYGDQPDFLNLACQGWTRLSPAELLARTREIEGLLGRERSFANAPRTLDIDVLAYGERVVNTAELQLPHPRLHLRRFVLEPLAEIAPGWRHPVLQRSAAELLAALGRGERIERVGTLRLEP